MSASLHEPKAATSLAAMQASNDLVHKLKDTCQSQLQAMSELQQDMISSHAKSIVTQTQQEQALSKLVCHNPCHHDLNMMTRMHCKS